VEIIFRAPERNVLEQYHQLKKYVAPDGAEFVMGEWSYKYPAPMEPNRDLPPG
jgi:hypothetical protein